MPGISNSKTHDRPEADIPVRRPVRAVRKVAVSMVGAACAMAATALLLTGCGSSPSGAPTMDPAIWRQAQRGLGAIKATADTSRQSSVTYDPGAVTPATISASDAKGYTWTLSIPPQALPAVTTITLTPDQTIAGPSGRGLASGVAFGPDGLVFAKPVTMTVTPPAGVTGVIPLYTVQADGSGLELAQMTAKNTATIFHFSGGAAGDPQSGEAAARAEWDSHVAFVQAFLREGNTKLGPPPRVSLHCGATNASSLLGNPAVDAYVHQAVNPELALGQDLIGAAQMLAFYGDESEEEAASGYVAELYGRVADRVTAAIASNQDNEDAYAALSATSLFVARVLSATGTDISSMTSATANWAIHLAELRLKDVTTSHKYSDYNEIMFLRNSAIGFGGDVSALSGEITKAFSFSVTINEDFDAPFTTIAGHPSTGNPVMDGFAYIATSLSGAATITGQGSVAPVATDKQVADLPLSGSASLAYSKVEIDPELGATTSAPGFSATLTASLKDVCGTSPSLQLQQSQYGSTETTVLSGTSSTSTMMQDLMSAEAQAAGQKNGNSALSIPLKDGQATGTFSYTIDDFFAAFGTGSELAQLRQVIKTITLEYTVKHEI
jgi:hypothetical protein